MKKFLDKFYQITEKLGKQNVILLIFIFIILVVTGLYQTFSLYTESDGVSILDGIKTLQFILNEDTEETSITIASGSSKNIAITVTNQEKINLQYGIYYSSNDDLSDVELGYLSSSQYSANDLIDADSSLIVEIKVYNNSDQDVTILFGTVYGGVNGGELILDDSKTLLEILYPYQYEVEYIESNGTQYIDTGIAPSNLSVQTELQYQYVSNLGTSADSVMGSRDNNDMSTRYYPSSLFGTTLDRHILGNGQFTTTSDLLKHTIVFNDAEHNYYLDGVLMSNLGTNFTPHYQPIYLFGLNTEGNFAYQSASRIYYCKIWDNEELVRDFIPVIDREGVPCLYDKVNDKLYYNENDGGDDFATNLLLMR